MSDARALNVNNAILKIEDNKFRVRVMSKGMFHLKILNDNRPCRAGTVVNDVQIPNSSRLVATSMSTVLELRAAARGVCKYAICFQLDENSGASTMCLIDLRI